MVRDHDLIRIRLQMDAYNHSPVLAQGSIPGGVGILISILGLAVFFVFCPVLSLAEVLIIC